MNRVGRRVLFCTLCVLSVCFLHANHGNNTNLLQVAIKQRTNSFLACATDCLGSPRCGWLIKDQHLKQCFLNETMDCRLLGDGTQVSNSGLLAYRRLHSGIRLDENKRELIFEQMNAADMGCTTPMTSCNSPPSVANADIEYDTLFPGSSAKYVCKDKFSICGSPQKTVTVTCLRKGSWEELSNGCSQTTWMELPTSAEPLPCPVREGSIFEIIGVPNSNIHFALELFGPNPGTIFMIDIRFNHLVHKNVVLCNTRSNQNKWGREEYAKTFPFTVWNEFNMTITVNTLDYDVKVDGNHLMSFTHRYPIDMITSFMIWGDVSLTSITFT